MAQKKGAPHRKDPRKARPGNKHGAKGPRIGRKEKAATSTIAVSPLPQPKAGAKIPSPPTGRPKTAGKDFAPGTNSHDGTVFRRTADMLPRGNFKIFAKCVYHDERLTLYERCVRIGRTGTNREVLALLDLLGNRIDGLPTKHVDVTQRREPTFLLTMPDGSVVPALPEKVGDGATPGAADDEDAVILGLQPVRE